MLSIVLRTKLSQREKIQGERDIGKRVEEMISPATTLALKSKHNNLLVFGVLRRAQSHSVLLWDAQLQIPALLTNSTVRRRLT